MHMVCSYSISFTFPTPDVEKVLDLVFRLSRLVFAEMKTMVGLVRQAKLDSHGQEVTTRFDENTSLTPLQDSLGKIS